MNPPLLEARNLAVRTKEGDALLADLSFCMGAGESLAVIGESGSGKTTLLRAVLGLLAPHWRQTGTVWFKGQNSAVFTVADWVLFRRKGAALIPQNPAGALIPFQTIRQQMAALLSGPDAARRAAWAFDLAGLEGHVTESWPHLLSGGEAQRAAIALALARGPDLLLADEPTAALDADGRRRIADALLRARDESGAALLVATHDFQLIDRLGGRLMALDHGRLAEQGPVGERLSAPQSQALSSLIAAERFLSGAGETPC